MLTPVPATIPGRGGSTRPIGTTRDGKGVSTKCVANELEVGAKDVEGFLARHGGSVTGDNAVPPPPGVDAGVALPPTAFLVTLAPSTFPLTDFAADAAALGVCDDVSFSSETVAHLMALFFHERRAGTDVSVNWLF